MTVPEQTRVPLVCRFVQRRINWQKVYGRVCVFERWDFGYTCLSLVPIYLESQRETLRKVRKGERKQTTNQINQLIPRPTDKRTNVVQLCEQNKEN